MFAKVQKWGNSRVPVQEFYYGLEELVAGITPENRHEEWDIGPPVGNEV